MTKPKQAEVDFSRSPGRETSFGRPQDGRAEPGTYDNMYDWKTNSKGFTIGEKRETRIEQTVGPGEYDADRATNLTKTKTVNINMGSSPSRPDFVGQTTTSNYSHLQQSL